MNGLASPARGAKVKPVGTELSPESDSEWQHQPVFAVAENTAEPENSAGRTRECATQAVTVTIRKTISDYRVEPLSRLQDAPPSGGAAGAASKRLEMLPKAAPEPLAVSSSRSGGGQTRSTAAGTCAGIGSGEAADHATAEAMAAQLLAELDRQSGMLDELLKLERSQSPPPAIRAGRITRGGGGAESDAHESMGDGKIWSAELDEADEDEDVGSTLSSGGNRGGGGESGGGGSERGTRIVLATEDDLAFLADNGNGLATDSDSESDSGGDEEGDDEQARLRPTANIQVHHFESLLHHLFHGAVVLTRTGARTVSCCAGQRCRAAVCISHGR